jgi:hypothetical protein
MSIMTGSNHNRMARQPLSDETLKEFGSQIVSFATETIARCNEALNAVAATHASLPEQCLCKAK